MGEYSGVWDESENFSQRIEKDPMGLGVMMRDKVAAPSYTAMKPRRRSRKVRPGQTRALRKKVQVCMVSDVYMHQVQG